VTYSATLSPQFAGPTDPSGSLELRDNGQPVLPCQGTQLTPNAVQQTRCVVGYTRSGRHQIIANYAGDTNFTGSASTPVTIVVPATKTGDARVVSRRAATVRGIVHDHGAAVTWRFQFWRPGGHLHRTRSRRLPGRPGATTVSVPLSGLRPATRYRFRLIATTVRDQGTPSLTWTGRARSLRTRR
jgi:hypothetical protein